MSSSRDFIDFVLDKLEEQAIFSTRAMFGEYALYANSKVVGLICNDTVYIKILPASKDLESECEKDYPYPGAKLYYVVTEEQLDSIPNLVQILLSISRSLPAKKKLF